MPLITIIIAIIIVGVVLWLVNTFLPMEPRIKQILNVVVIICLVIWLLVTFLGGSLGSVRVGH